MLCNITATLVERQLILRVSGRECRTSMAEIFREHNFHIYKNPYWLDFVDESIEAEHPDGYFVSFFYGNVQLITTSSRDDFLSKIRLTMKKFKIRFVKVSLPSYDRVVIHTTVDRRRMTDVRNALILGMGAKADRTLWFSEYEDSNTRQEGQWGKLLNDIYTAYEKKLSRYSDVTGKNIIMLQSKLWSTLYREEIMNRESMVVKPIFRPITYTENPKTAFVLMPFKEQWSNDVYYLIKQASEKAGVSVSRADDFFDPNVIMDDIWKSINESSVIIADITVHNPNVFYELGIAHTLGKTVIVIKQTNDTPVPFDITARRFLEYGLAPTQAQMFIERLSTLLNTHTAKR